MASLRDRLQALGKGAEQGWDAEWEQCYSGVESVLPERSLIPTWPKSGSCREQGSLYVMSVSSPGKGEAPRHDRQIPARENCPGS